jgi:hypothetical protein
MTTVPRTLNSGSEASDTVSEPPISSALTAESDIYLRANNALRSAFARELVQVPAAEIAADPDGLMDAERMLAVYRREVAPTFKPWLVEAPFTAKVNGVILSGTIDGADDDVRDLKTTAGKTINGRKPRFDPANYDIQMTLYRFGYKALTGRWPRRLLLDVLTRRGTYRQYEREPKNGDALDALGVARDGILRGEFDANGALNGSCFYCPYIEVCDYAIRD